MGIRAAKGAESATRGLTTHASAASNGVAREARAAAGTIAAKGLARVDASDATDDEPAKPLASSPALSHASPLAPAPVPEAPVKTMTPAASPASPASPAPSASAQEAVRVAESLGHKRVLASGEAHGHIVVPELGRVDVHARAERVNASVNVHVHVDDAQARALLQQHAPELRAHVQADVPNAHVHLDQRNPGNHGQPPGREPAQGDRPETDEDDAPRQILPRRGAARYVL